eukprot:CAMPEP_0174384208 /NCGR_PEP_ID=MMETSP0811_2-20130205/125768_1 /TAXON_ID=73025 ORGANISM="Eutreptiella gymnastica-like, Strain CCMP1594" /NCGR_SAMPLE_ID=MMETSP0811_2 /ASSEMBLY_ACC=CAM_ASM_000667 /LENGTH=68 /DNA_ID=CAMNT_0015538091 /DNA_START=236 /DNA_END=442 /DNA_ORIENTATION=+
MVQVSDNNSQTEIPSLDSQRLQEGLGLIPGTQVIFTRSTSKIVRVDDEGPASLTGKEDTWGTIGPDDG